jgi:hypothetical protein
LKTNLASWKPDAAGFFINMFLMFWGVMTRLQVTGNGGVFMRANNIPLGRVLGASLGDALQIFTFEKKGESWGRPSNIHI